MYAEIYLPYFKQGDDLAHHLENTNSIVDAFTNHSLQMEHVSKLLKDVSLALEQHTNELDEISVDACTHHISISGPENIIQELINKGLAEKPDWIDEEDDEFLIKEEEEFTFGVDDEN